MGYAVFELSLWSRKLVVAGQRELAIFQLEHRICSPLRQVRAHAARCTASAPFVREQDRRAIIVERGRMPVGEVGVRNILDTDRIGWIGNVEQNAVPRTGTTGKTQVWVCGNVVAAICAARGLRSWTVITAFPEACDVAVDFKDARLVDHA